MKTTVTPLDIDYSVDERSAIFFRHLKRELGILNPVEVFTLVGTVLAYVQRGLSAEQSRVLVGCLPRVFRALLAKNRNVSGTQKSYSYLDELVEDLYENDRRSEHSLFSTEVQALNAVVTVLRSLDKFLGLFRYNILNHQFVQGLRQIPLEEAV